MGAAAALAGWFAEKANAAMAATRGMSLIFWWTSIRTHIPIGPEGALPHAWTRVLDACVDELRRSRDALGFGSATLPRVLSLRPPSCP